MAYSFGKFRIQVDETAHSLFRELTEAGSEPISVPFLTMKDVFMWAALLGFQEGLRKPLGKKREIFSGNLLDNDSDRTIISGLVLASTKEVESLESPEMVLAAFEEFANGGIALLHTWIFDGGYPLISFSDFALDWDDE